MLYEISEVCDKIALINHGLLLGFDKMENLEDKLRTKEIRCEIVDPILPENVGSLITNLSQNLEPYLDNTLEPSISNVPIVYNQQEKHFIIYYDGKKESKVEILNILFNKFKSDFTIHSFSEPMTSQLERLYSQIIKDEGEIPKIDHKRLKESGNIK